VNEQETQEAIVLYLQLKYKKIRFCASAGGVRTSITQARKMKRAGYVKGMPDLQIMEARQGKHGLFIELKTKTGRLTKEQKQWLEDLNKRNYLAKCCKGAGEAMDLIDWYLK
tara:strand:+ start:1745 stop:2080 length:336 start_codon:yes stop_codon:yes gene_type:complete